MFGQREHSTHRHSFRALVLDEAHVWGVMSGLLLAAGVFGHALRLVTLGLLDEAGVLVTDDRYWVAGGAIALYGVATAFTLARRRVGLWIAVLGPLGGLLAITVLPDASVDTFQIVLGIPQIVALALGVWLLLHGKKGPEPGADAAAS